MKFLLLIFTLLVAQQSWSKGLGYYLKCNKKQSKCYVDTSRVTIDDKVGFFDGDDLVATGIVSSASGEKKVIDIKKKYARIRHSHKIKLLSDEEFGSPTMRVFKDYKKMKAGAAIGFGQFNSSGVLEGFSLGMHFDYMQGIYGFGWTGRLNIYSASKEVNYNIGIDSFPQDYSLLDFSLLVGGSWQSSRNNPVSVRVEAAVGGGYSLSEVGGLPAQEQDPRYAVSIDDGFNLDFGARISLLYNMSKWQPEVALQVNRLGTAPGWYVYLGAVYAIK